MIVLVRVRQTVFACPSVWDAWDAQGHPYELRYRHGRGTVRDAVDGPWGEVLASFWAGHPLDGVMRLGEFMARVEGFTLAPDAVVENLPDPNEGYEWE